MILRNLDNYRDLAEISDDGRSIKRIPETDVGEQRPSGLFWEMDGRLFGLGVDKGEMLLLLDCRIKAVTSSVKVGITDCAGRRTFSVFDGGHLVSEVQYEPQKPYWNFFAMEDEDVDGFVWINNVLASPERMSILIKTNG